MSAKYRSLFVVTICQRCHVLTKAYGSIFLYRDWANFARKKFRQRPKNCYANPQNYFARLTPTNNYLWKSRISGTLSR